MSEQVRKPRDAGPPGTGEAERRLQLALEAGRLGTWEWDVPTSRVVWSESLERIHGLEPGSFAGTFEAYQRDMHPDDRARVLATIRGSLERRSSYEVSYRIVRPDGAVRWLEARGAVVCDADGEPARMLGVCQDVTERRHASEALRFLAEASAILGSSLDYHETLRSLAQVTVPRLADWCVVDIVESDGVRRVAVAQTDPRKMALANELARRYPLDPSSDTGVAAVLRNGSAELVSEISDELLRRTARDREHYELLQALGLRSYICVPLKARGEILGALTLVTAESGIRYTEDDLSLAQELAARAAVAVDNARLYQEAQQALRARDEVFAVVSHDLRNPLQAIALSVSILQEAEPDAAGRQKRYEVIARATRRASGLIEDLRDVARVEAGAFSVSKAPTDIEPLVRELCNMFDAHARARHVRLEVKLPPSLHRVHADRGRVFRVFSNLTGNALEFSPEGGVVTISADATETEVRFAISDRGPGIDPDDLSQIFEPFRQGRRAVRGGAGLGLSICKGIVEAHGGRIWATSEPGTGTTVHFTLPIAS